MRAISEKTIEKMSTACEKICMVHMPPELDKVAIIGEVHQLIHQLKLARSSAFICVIAAAIIGAVRGLPKADAVKFFEALYDEIISHEDVQAVAKESTEAYESMKVTVMTAKAAAMYAGKIPSE